ncbi:hypothetical protein [Streptomyces sp. NPDC023838]|uniref:hypothetical protein n=1 Tax=Streptomyces sp. NPDC023838 TaxID=3154325 RepID=UPI0033EE6844
MRFSYLQLGSDADAEEAVDRPFESVMDAWPRMLSMEHLEGCTWTILKNRSIDQQRRRKTRPDPGTSARSRPRSRTRPVIPTKC